MPRLILRSGQCPGDVVVMTAAVRELHRQYPNQYQTDVRTCAPAIWEHNPYITPIADDNRDARTIEMHYPLINQSNQRPVHFLEGVLRIPRHAAWPALTSAAGISR